MSFSGIPAAGAALVLVSSLGLAGCVEASVYDKTAAQLEVAARASQQKDQQLRALEWQMVSLGQQFRESQQRSEALQREIWGQLQQAAAINATLQERLKTAESERAGLAGSIAEEAAAGAKGRQVAAPLRPEELRRLLAAIDARNVQLLDRIHQLEQLIQSRPAEVAPRPKPPDTDVVDPWGFGSRR